MPKRCHCWIKAENTVRRQCFFFATKSLNIAYDIAKEKGFKKVIAGIRIENIIQNRSRLTDTENKLVVKGVGEGIN